MRIIMLPTINSMIKLLEKKSNSIASSGIISLIFISLFSVFFGSCSKEPGQIGLTIQPEDSKLSVFYSDTSSIYAYSEALDSIRTDKLSVSGFGSLKDPVFGSTTAGIYTQFILSLPEQDFGDEGRYLDSLVLQLNYEGYYGDTNITLTAHTYEILDNLDSDSTYYSNVEINQDVIDYSNFSFSPRPNDSIIVNEDTLPAALRINLSDISTDLGERLLNATVDEMVDNETFQEFFNGLFIQSLPIDEDGGLVYFGLTSSNSKLSLYYGNSENDSLRFDYYITSSTATINKYEHNYDIADLDFKNQVINGDTLLGAHKFYAQGYGGVQSVIKIPHIQNWAELDNIAINEAKLTLPGYSEDEFFDAPAQMYLLEIGEDGLGETFDDQTEGGTYFGGEYNESSDLYEFRITRYIQSMISDTTKANRGLYLILYGGSVNPERYIFQGNEVDADSISGIKLKLLYTEL